MTNILFSGILCNPRMACAGLADGGSRFHYYCIHFDLLLAWCNGTRTDPVAFENGFAIRVAVIPNRLHMLCRVK